MALRTLIGLALVAGLSGLAAPAAAEEWRPPRWQRGFAFAGGATQIGDLGFAQIGLQAHLARRLTPRLHLGLSGEMLNTNRGTGEELVVGETLRALLGVEVDLRDPPRDEMISFRAVGLAGAGSEVITWERGYAARPFGYVGAEFHVRFGIRDDGILKNLSSMGHRSGIRLQVAPSTPSEDVPMRCSGECAPYPAADRTDVAFLVYFGLDFGL